MSTAATETSGSRNAGIVKSLGFRELNEPQSLIQHQRRTALSSVSPLDEYGCNGNGWLLGFIGFRVCGTLNPSGSRNGRTTIHNAGSSTCLRTRSITKGRECDKA